MFNFHCRSVIDGYLSLNQDPNKDLALLILSQVSFKLYIAPSIFVFLYLLQFVC